MIISKRVVLIGPTGAGKSWLANQLLNRKAFKSAASTKSITNTINEATNEIILEDNKTLKLTVVDTPGIGDTQGRSDKIMDDIVTNIRTHEPNMLLIVLPYGRIDTGLQNKILALNECINGYYESSTLFIMNQIPSDYQLEENDPPQTLKDVICEAHDDFAKNLKLKTLAITIFIQTQREKNNDLKKLMKIMYDTIVHSTNVPPKELRTWTETLDYYQGIIGGKSSTKDSLDKEIARKADLLAFGEFEKKIFPLGIFGGPLGIAAVYFFSDLLQETIQTLRSEIESLSGETANIQHEVEKAKVKLAEIRNYL
ncbi:unnamed protein product [Adineta steineri]|uniref:AIG1-type G domain-containing protein n=1 Tax=Adineta steineri TaxID=433720 RepID=A0A819MTY6_9BILA|nr:unnamed protein product [Adineta steineri]CAF3985852.1 unnamed protein product [Adineta steineri]